MSVPSRLSADPDRDDALVALRCDAQVAALSVICKRAPDANASGVSRDVIGGQEVYVRMNATNLTYNSGTGLFQFDATIQNLMNEAIGTPNGTFTDLDGIKVFMHQQLTATTGSGSMSVLNSDGAGTFTGSNQQFFLYPQLLVKDEVSAPKTWQFQIPSSVGSFSFEVYVWTSIQPLLVVNEILTNPGGTISDANGEWVELYNAGTRAVNLQNLVIADSARSSTVRGPYHRIASSIVVQPGAYVVLGNATNTTNNGGVPVDYPYAAALAFPNSTGAFKISRVWGNDTLTVDRVQYASAATSAQNGIARELKNPGLDNSNVDGANWADALVSSVYGPGGRGTPKAQNSTFTP